jgi:hypothetical protein
MERLVILVVAGALALFVAAPAAAGDPAPKGEAAARAALWEALQKAKPKWSATRSLVHPKWESH